jgi:integrase
MKRRTKRSHEVAKRCDCLDPKQCEHPWWLRVKVKGEKRQRVNLSELFPSDAVDVAAAKAKDLARKGLIKGGQIVTAQPSDTRPTCRYVAEKYVAARGGEKNYYLDGLMDTVAPDSSVKIGDKPVDDVLTRDIKHAAALWKERAKTKAGAHKGADAIRHLLQSARHFFKWAKVEGYSTRTPFRDAQGTVLISVGKSRTRKRRLQDGEAERILAVADPYITDFFTAMLETGCRPGELRTLQWTDIHDEHFVVIAEKAKDREDREVPIMPPLAKILERRQLGPDGKKLSSDAYVFGDDIGRVISTERLCERWRKICATAKIEGLHLHDLRAEFASQLSESKVPIDQVRDALGHSSIKMTDTYLRSRKGRLTEAYRKRAQHQARKRMKLVV